jgi:ATP-binding cassette subfamily F protein uup
MPPTPLISAQKVTKIFGIRPLFTDISVAVSEGERVGVVGPNGSGKSTLLRILAGLEEPDEGDVALRKDLAVRYVAQEDRFPDGSTVESVLREAVPTHEGNPDGRVAEACGIAGFTERNALTAELSGGQRKRLAIAAALVSSPELLLLDEPTNHLDIAGVEWLEGVLQKGNFAAVFISHDRYFIENVAARVLEIDRRYPGGFFSVTGTYSEFLENRAVFLEQREQYQASLANKVRREVEWLRRGAKARTTKAKGRIDRAGDLIAELKGFEPNARTAGIAFSGSERKTQELIRVEGITKRLGERVLFEDVTVTLAPGTRLGVVGNNGSGKTTFLNTLLGKLSPDNGRVVQAPRLKIAVLDQRRSALSLDQKLQELFCRSGDSVVFQGREYHASAWARRFLFRPEQLKLPVSELSGGERARALIARLMLEPADILVLDEPTNDLDIPTLEVLEEALDEFSGAVVLVTHDRYLLDRVASTVVGLTEIPGKRSLLYADYHQWVAVVEGATGGKDAKKSAPLDVREGALRPESKKLSYMEHRELKAIEGKIEAAEKKVVELQASLTRAEVVSDGLKLQAQCKLLAEAQAEVETLFGRWAELDSRSKK